jgi:phosphotransferase system enzyme I (PtsI)
MNSGPPIHLSGIAASPGYAEGPLHPLESARPAYAPKGDAEAERMALVEAVAEASARIAVLIEQAIDESAAMLEFQLAMLDDEALAAPSLAAIADGAPADTAWTRALDAEIAGYESSEDEYFRARAADLRDIRDQVLRALTETAACAAPPGAILFGDDIAPTRFLETDWSQGGGIALSRGSTASHVAMLARARGIPMVVGLGDADAAPAGLALLDAEQGGLVVSPAPQDVSSFHARAQTFAEKRRAAGSYLHRPAATRDGVPVRVLVNVADPSDVDAIDIATCDGVGLMRTEFLFGRQLPDEETQLAAYRKVLEWAAGKPVTIRTVDAGGDKPVPGFTVDEPNPFLGLRGIRLSLARPEIFRVQVRALLRAAMLGTLKVMFPMVALRAEYDRAAAIFDEEAQALSAAGIAHRLPPLGMMVEVPAAAIAPERFGHVAFLSIGSNDLTQYVMAAARDNSAVAALNDVRDTAVMRLIGSVAAFAAERTIPLSLCGDAGGDPRAIPDLLKAGIREVSVAPAQLAVAKAAIAAVEI